MADSDLTTELFVPNEIKKGDSDASMNVHKKDLDSSLPQNMGSEVLDIPLSTNTDALQNNIDESKALEITNDDELNELKSEKHDPYSYTKLTDFTSEIFKIEINNLPNYVGYGQLRKLLNGTLNLKTRKIKAIGKPPSYVFCTFCNEEDRNNALKLLNGYFWKGKSLSAKKANPAADPLVQKRKAEDSEELSSNKKIKIDDIKLKLKDAVTPFWQVPYEEQLEQKSADIRKFLVKLGRSLDQHCKILKDIIKKNRKENNYQCCPFSAIKPSPVTSAYRNKCEFTVGRHLLTNEKTVGFRLSSYKAGCMSVAEPDDCVNISTVMLKAVKSFQEYVRLSDKDVYNPENHEGYWRQLTVRTSNNSDVLIIIVMHPQSLKEEELKLEMNELTEYFETGPGSNFGITSVYFQMFSKRESSEENTNLIHLVGKKYLEETLLGMKFVISPGAFFQINVPATEVLYSMVCDYASITPNVTVLDICCGTGTISLCLAKAGAKVIGIEMCPEAVENAELNAKNNGVTNVEFVCGKAENVIFSAINKCDESSDIIAIVDPPRAGLHPKVLKAIRATLRIKKLIYVSCNPKSAFHNFVDLCRPPSNNYKGPPFYPTEAAAVDMFPYTPHKELVLIFDRCP